MKLLFLISFLFVNIEIMALELSGTIISDNEKNITSKFMGFIKNITAKEGEIVKKGDLLYEIDSSEIDSKKEQLNFSLQINHNQYDTVNRNYERYLRLYEKGLVSKYEVEQLELSSNNLKNMVNINKSQIKEIENQYKYLKILAPNDGVILKKYIKSGEMSIPGVTTFIISDLEDLVIKIDMNESHFKDIFIGQEVDIYIDSLNQYTKGKISSIIPNSNQISHTFVVKISIDKLKYLYPGMYVRILINL